MISKYPSSQSLGSTHISFWVYFHLRHHAIVLHVLLANVATILDRFDSRPQLVRVDDTGLDGRLRDECYACLRY